ncbi:hypothetical protein JAO29_20440 [Edaphobacter sp. HDX4]|uniref:hypothetical protein n=1 Tax=Edaphobacter sp. HDX4 TaxID=2794064 RepID=UPI002FE61D8F
MAIAIIQQVGGTMLIMLILLDVFLTVLYARMGSGLLSRRVGRIVWRCFWVIAQTRPDKGDRILSFCGPVILAVLVFTWVSGLALGNAFLIHPMLGRSVQSTSGKTPTDLVSALYAGGSSLSIIGSSDFTPRTSGSRLLYLFNSIAGLSVTSLTLTYLMQIYNQLQQRNAFALKVYLATRRTGDAAELVAGIAPEGSWTAGASSLWELAAETAVTKEAHHFYPMLFYMRFPDHYYSISFITLVLLDSITLIRCALGEDYNQLKHLGALDELWEGSLLLLTALEQNFLQAGAAHREQPNRSEISCWTDRFMRAKDRLRAAGISTADDEQQALSSYVAMRSQWNHHIRRLAPSMMYRIEDIDSATYGKSVGEIRD